jgi:signal transduction histidine kinase
MPETEKLLFTLVLEVRNTLKNINLTLGQLSVETLSAEMRTHFEIILRNVKQVLKLISALTSQSNPAAVYLKKRPLQSVMDEAIEDVIDLIIEKKINLAVQYEKEPSFAQIDRDRVKTAFVNIMLNVIASVPEKSGKLQIEVKRKAGKHIVEIRDNRYSRNVIISRKNPVTLMNSLSILQASRVQVDVSSANQIGTTFTMEFAQA